MLCVLKCFRDKYRPGGYAARPTALDGRPVAPPSWRASPAPDGGATGLPAPMRWTRALYCRSRSNSSPNWCAFLTKRPHQSESLGTKPCPSGLHKRPECMCQPSQPLQGSSNRRITRTSLYAEYGTRTLPETQYLIVRGVTCKSFAASSWLSPVSASRILKRAPSTARVSRAFLGVALPLLYFIRCILC